MNDKIVIADTEVLEVLREYSLLGDPDQERTLEGYAISLILERLRDSTVTMEEELTEMGLYEYFKGKILRLALKYGMFIPDDVDLN